MVDLNVACAQLERTRVRPAGALLTSCRTPLYRRHDQGSRTLDSAVTASQMPHLQSPLESGAVGVAPPSTEAVRYARHVRMHSRQSTPAHADFSDSLSCTGSLIMSELAPGKTWYSRNKQPQSCKLSAQPASKA